MERTLDSNVYESALERFRMLYATGKVIVSFSGGKDSGICVELAVVVAKETKSLPVMVAMRDEEIMFPGTFEYSERIAERPEIDFGWYVAGQPVLNVYNRELPYYWVFDPLLKPEQWMREPPVYAQVIPDLNIIDFIKKSRFGLSEDDRVYSVMGLRASESMNRRMGIFSKQGWIRKHENRQGILEATPIYDWKDADVYRAIKEFGWDYNHAYDIMYRMGVPKSSMRIAPPLMSLAGIKELSMARRAWPRWFTKLEERCPGTRNAAMFGRLAVTPIRKMGESWEECFKRTCLEDAPEWIRARAEKAMQNVLAQHSRHSTTPFPESNNCRTGCGLIGSWKSLSQYLYCGDPFALKSKFLDYVEPEFFRKGSGTWGGKPSW